jgi:hypothetical protein
MKCVGDGIRSAAPCNCRAAPSLLDIDLIRVLSYPRYYTLTFSLLIDCLKLFIVMVHPPFVPQSSLSRTEPVRALATICTYVTVMVYETTDTHPRTTSVVVNE